MIKIAKELELPLDGITQTFAQIGKRGAGKTYLASMIAEQMLDAHAQIIVMDPIGNWWGLRVDADGKSKGKDIFIIGGAHGDVPLASEGGKEIAKLLVEKSISVVLDISEFRKNERKKFVTDFAEEFFQLKKSKPSAVHIFLEESQKFIPQTVRGDDARMVGAWEDIVRLGRNYGIGCSLITQRPQSVNKEVLSQVECLCVLQVVGRHERKALEEWIREAGEDRSIIDKLPGLHRGEGYVWSPSWLRIFKRVNFNKKTTFDTSATPKLGEATKSAKISKIDIEKLRKEMTHVVEKINKEKVDRKTLISEISRLEKELRLAKHSQPKPIADEKALERARHQGFKESENHYLSKLKLSENTYRSIEKVLKKYKDFLKQFTINCSKLLQVEIPKFNELPKFNPKPIQSEPQIQKTREVTSQRESSIPLKEKVPYHDISNDIEGDISLTLCARKIYSFLFANPNREFSRIQLATITGYSHKSGGFGDAISRLNILGLIKKNETLISVGELKQEFATEDSSELSIDIWLGRLNKCTRTILKLLLDNPYESYSRVEIAEQTEYSVTSGGFGDAISKLNVLGMIIKDGSQIKINPELLEI